MGTEVEVLKPRNCVSDPREDPKFKHQRYEDKVIQLLGAILDALKVLAPKPRKKDE